METPSKTYVAIEIRDTIRAHSPLPKDISDLLIHYAVSVEHLVAYGETIYPRDGINDCKPPWHYGGSYDSEWCWTPLELMIDPDMDREYCVMLHADDGGEVNWSWKCDPDTAMSPEHIAHYRKYCSPYFNVDEYIPRMLAGYNDFLASCLHSLTRPKPSSGQNVP